MPPKHARGGRGGNGGSSSPNRGNSEQQKAQQAEPQEQIPTPQPEEQEDQGIVLVQPTEGTANSNEFVVTDSVVPPPAATEEPVEESSPATPEAVGGIVGGSSLPMPPPTPVNEGVLRSSVSSAHVPPPAPAAAPEAAKGKSPAAGVNGKKQTVPPKDVPKVDRKFFRRLWRILKICLPMGSREQLYLIGLSILLVSRTYLSVLIARVAGRNGQNLVSRRWNQFYRGVGVFLVVTLPAAAVNSGLRYFTSVLALGMRAQLSKNVNKEYLNNVNYYKAVHLSGSKLDNPDQRVTADISNFAEAMSNLYAETFKPILDVLLYTYQLLKLLGWQGGSLMYAYFILSALIKKLIMPGFGKLVAEESRLEGNYRTNHNRLIANAEEIAFYDGSVRERGIIEQSFQQVYAHLCKIRRMRLFVGIFDGLLVKYWASLTGYFVVASPFLLQMPRVMNQTTEESMRDYIMNSQYLAGLSQAVGQLVLVGNKLTSIAGYTHRVSELLEAVSHLSQAGTVPFEVEEEVQEEYVANADTREWLLEWKKRCEQRVTTKSVQHQVTTTENGGTVESGHDSIKFTKATLVAPDGQLLAEDLTFEVQPNSNVMIVGPNGCGKSSLFRIIGELWPLNKGTLEKPNRGELLFVPQKPYLVLGTLRDQIIYPHTEQQMKALNVTDDDLKRLLESVDPLGTIIKKWDLNAQEKDWGQVLSGGQMQRIAMARVFYHHPKYAVLDECTSCVSDEVEDAVYEICKVLGVTIFTVSHRPALRRHHDRILAFDGRGKVYEEVIDHSKDSEAH